MGGSNQSFPRHHWSHLQNTERYEIWNNDKGRLAEKHVVPADPHYDDDDELEAYDYRHNHHKPLVGVYDARFQEKSSGCSNDRNIEVMTEYIPYRLSETRNLNDGQALYVLSESLAGFQELYHKVGCFPIIDSMIGFNQDGQTKVWHNPNFADNSLWRDGVVLVSTKNHGDFDETMALNQEHDMVEDVWNAVERHAVISPGLRSETFGLRDYSFYEARNKLKHLVDTNFTFVPDHLRLQDRQGIMDKLYQSQRLNASKGHFQHPRDRDQRGAYYAEDPRRDQYGADPRRGRKGNSPRRAHSPTRDQYGNPRRDQYAENPRRDYR